MYIVFWLLVRLLIEINYQMTPFEELQRSRRTITLINDKLYILGGLDYDDNIEVTGKQFFYLDVSVSFNTQKLTWNDLTSINMHLLMVAQIIIPYFYMDQLLQMIQIWYIHLVQKLILGMSQ